ncbi:PcfB family protein [Paludicola sp. MB14-C6]|uniref:PcfB family protein n=1 Tax=Paludihabitans sp. MB14-C6 TaxID=3070656 RepID=UPI0027DD1F64|nr:PcfB family protein [Paludicola sp. MB14-C6]WMJ22891.1 PcfB family protein [Paludicola sp. MB14-C6]
MNTGGDVAEQIVRMSLNGVEVAAKITGAGAKQLAMMLYAMSKEQNKTKGKMRMSSMIKSGKELKVFSINDKDLQKFTEVAKKYGVLYCVLRDKDITDGLSDIMVRAEDASKINRIFERLQLGCVDVAAIKSELVKNKETKHAAKQEADKGYESKDNKDQLIDKLMEKPTQKEQPTNQNPTMAQTIKSFPSEPTSKSKKNSAKGVSSKDDISYRPSVRKELNEIKREKTESSKVSTPQKQLTHKAPKKKKSKKVKGRS